MRLRDEIKRTFAQGFGYRDEAFLEVLLDIRDLLQNPPRIELTSEVKSGLDKII